MKNTALTLILGLLALQAGCRSMASDPQPSCPPLHVNLIANQGNEKAPTVLKITPDTIKVKKNCSFEIRFPTSAGRSVKTEGSTASWLTRDAQTTFPMVIDVPAGTTTNTYKYSIEVVGFGELDPRVIVIN
jgi:hypothetical protein